VSTSWKITTIITLKLSFFQNLDFLNEFKEKCSKVFQGNLKKQFKFQFKKKSKLTDFFIERL